MITSEMKIARNGSLIVKLNGKSVKFYETASAIGNMFNQVEIRIDYGKTYTITYRQVSYAIYRVDEIGNIYKNDYFHTEKMLQNIARNNIIKNLHETVEQRAAWEREMAMLEAVVNPEAQDAVEEVKIEDTQPQDELKIKLDRLYRHKALLTKAEFEHMERKLNAAIGQRAESQKIAEETPLTKE